MILDLPLIIGLSSPNVYVESIKEVCSSSEFYPAKHFSVVIFVIKSIHIWRLCFIDVHINLKKGRIGN